MGGIYVLCLPLLNFIFPSEFTKLMEGASKKKGPGKKLCSPNRNEVENKMQLHTMYSHILYSSQ